MSGASNKKTQGISPTLLKVASSQCVISLTSFLTASCKQLTGC